MVLTMAPVSATEWTLNSTDSIEANISLASPGDTLILNPGTYSQYNITVSKDITIKSNSSAGGSSANTIIDAMKSGRIFNDNSSAGYSLDIEGLTLKNGSAENGGALYVVNGTVSISSSIITSCYATFSGGGVYSENVVDAESCIFIDCPAGMIAGAGGAIASHVVRATSCTFTRCGSMVIMGGAIASDDVTAVSCIFTGCSALAGGGGIFSDEVVIRSCDFTDCATYDPFGLGGAVSSLNVTAESCTFTNCSSGGDGGGIYSLETDVLSCIFTECSAQGGGGISSVNATVTSSTFSGCNGSGIYSYGGAICSDYITGGTFLISSSSFNDCRASAGGALYFEFSGITVTSCTFTGCRGADSGGAILSMDNDYLDIGSSTFTGCSALDYAGAILSDTDYVTLVTITSSIFIGCSADNKLGGAVYANNTISAMHYCRIYDCNTGTAVVMEGGTLDAENNWWGTNSDPSVYTAAVSGGPVDVMPWLVMGTTASPSSVTAGGSSVISADLTRNSAGEDTSSGGYVPDGIPVTFGLAAGPGSLSSLSGLTGSGVSTTTYSSSSAGTATIAATVDGQMVECTVLVNPGGGSSSGGSGGGSNTDTGIGVVGALEAGENISLDMNKGAVYRVVLTAGTDIEKLMITVKKESSVPSSIGEPDTDVYEYEDITLYYAKDSELSGRTFFFKILESWLTSNGYDYSDIVMLVYNEETGGWDKLETTYDGDKGSYHYYIAESPYIARLAIAYMEGATILPPGEEESAEVTGTPTAEVTVSATVSPSKTTVPSSSGDVAETSWSSVIIIVVAFLLIIIVVIGLAGRRKREKYPDWWDHGRK